MRDVVKLKKAFLMAFVPAVSFGNGPNDVNDEAESFEGEAAEKRQGEAAENREGEAAENREGDTYAGAHYALGEYQLDNDLDFETDDSDLAMNFNPDFDVDIIAARFGYYFHPRLAVEGRFGLGISDATTSDSTSNVENINGGRVEADLTGEVNVEIDNIFGGYLVGDIIQRNLFSLYAIGGLTRIEGKGSFSFDGEVRGYANDTLIIQDGISEEGDESFDAVTLTYGAGVNFFITEDFALNAEWIKYQTNAEDDDTEWDLEAINAGITYSF